jgi:hypothetical protein
MSNKITADSCLCTAAVHAEVKRDIGEVLMMKYIVAELICDVRARLQVFHAHEAGLACSSVLQSSQLWRLITACSCCRPGLLGESG